MLSFMLVMPQFSDKFVCDVGYLIIYSADDGMLGVRIQKMLGVRLSGTVRK